MCFIFMLLCGNDSFSSGKRDLDFKMWPAKGIYKVMDLYSEKKLLSSEEFKDICDIWRTQINGGKWINDLQEDATEGEWTEICSSAHSVTIHTHNSIN